MSSSIKSNTPSSEVRLEDFVVGKTYKYDDQDGTIFLVDFKKSKVDNVLAKSRLCTFQHIYQYFNVVKTFERLEETETTLHQNDGTEYYEVNSSDPMFKVIKEMIKENNEKISFQNKDTVNQIMIWVPTNMSKNNDGLDVAETMIKNLKVKKIHSKGYSHFRQLFIDSGSSEHSFCKNMSTKYLLFEAERHLTLLSVRQLKTDFSIKEIYAMLVFKVDKLTGNSPSHLEVIAFCGNDNNKMAKGHGTKLLNLVKQSMSLAKIDNIILNPTKNAIPYYVKQFFKLTVPGDDYYRGESYDMMKSHLPTEKRLRKSLKPHSLKPKSASHTSKRRSASHSSKRSSASSASKRRSASSASKRSSASSTSKRSSASSFTFYAPSSHERLSIHSKSFKSLKSKEENAKIEELFSSLCKMFKDTSTPINGHEKTIRQDVQTAFHHFFKSDDNPNPQLNDSQMNYLNSLIESCK